MINEKKINKTGSITIPAFMRRDIGIESGEKMRIEKLTNGDLVLKRIAGSCILCGNIKDLVHYGDKFVCKNCIDKLNELKD